MREIAGAPHTVRRLLPILVVAVWACASVPAHATAAYDYKPNEYVIVDHGLAPNNKYSIAAHGEGEGGSENFHLYLMAEPEHETIAPLAAVDSDAILDSGPTAFYARWAPDSRHVAILFRADRHIQIMVLYEFREGQLHRLKVPTLFSAVTKAMAESNDTYTIRSSASDLTWRGPATVKLTEHRLYESKTPDLAHALGAFGRREAKPRNAMSGDNKRRRDRHFVEFSAEAVGVLASGERFQIKDLKPAPFENPR